MNPVDYVIIALIAAAVGAAVFFLVRKKGKRGCCGDCSRCDRRR